MRLTRIRVEDFKRHERLELEPAAGLTIIRGPNEAGKSSLQQAIGLALYRKADANREDLRRAQRWGTDEPPEIVLDFEVDGTSGTLRKRFAGSRGVAELRYAGETIQDQDRIAETVAELTGIPTASFFRATASVGHAELAQVSGDEPDIQDRLQEAVSGADRGTAGAKRKLETAIHRFEVAAEVREVPCAEAGEESGIDEAVELISDVGGGRLELRCRELGEPGLHGRHLFEDAGTHRSRGANH